MEGGKDLLSCPAGLLVAMAAAGAEKPRRGRRCCCCSVLVCKCVCVGWISVLLARAMHASNKWMLMMLICGCGSPCEQHLLPPHNQGTNESHDMSAYSHKACQRTSRRTGLRGRTCKMEGGEASGDQQRQQYNSGGSSARNREEVNFARERGQNHMRAHIKAGIRAHRATLLIFIKLFRYLRLSFLSGQRSFCCDLPLSCFGAYKRGGGAHFEINTRHRQTP